MSKVTKTLARLLRGNADSNLRFDDLRAVLTNLGFDERIRGDLHIFTHPDVADILNLQPRNGMAKPYQVRQVRTLLTSSELAGVPEEDSNEGETELEVPEQDDGQ